MNANARPETCDGGTRAPSAVVPAAEPAVPATDASAKEVEARYLEAVDALVDEALARGQLETMVEVLSWELARVAHACGPLATADVLCRFGGHLGQLAQRQRDEEQARKEAKAAKRRGLRPH